MPAVDQTLLRAGAQAVPDIPGRGLSVPDIPCCYWTHQTAVGPHYVFSGLCEADVHARLSLSFSGRQTKGQVCGNIVLAEQVK